MNECLYSLLLRLYPAELRNDFGSEMMEVFLEDAEHRGALRVWWCSIKELCRVALPAGASKREITVPVIMYFLTIGLWAPEHAKVFGLIPVAFVIPVIPALTTLVALCAGNRSVPVPLDLNTLPLRTVS